MRHSRGFTLLEVMLAAGLMAGLIIVVLDLLPDIFRTGRQEDTSQRLNWEARRLLDRIQSDIRTAGFRFLPPITTDGQGNPVAAIAGDTTSLTLRGIVAVGELAQPVASGDTQAFINGFNNLRNADFLIWTNNGLGGCRRLTAIAAGGGQVTVEPAGFPTALPAGTLVAAVRTVTYTLQNGLLSRRVNGAGGAVAEVEQYGVDPAVTSFQYLVNTTPPQLLNTLPANLNNLIAVHINLRMVRNVNLPGGSHTAISTTIQERVSPLNL
ncbi:MAG: hypothetical protein K6U03_00125 [Firmicutes bacterium]|nr:hypothetical protein [Bacillota bacterium]